MMQRPWAPGTIDEWLPRSLRLCWGGSGDGGSSGSGSGDGGGWGGDGGGFGGSFGGATTGGGDWGSSGSYDASSFNAADASFYSSALGDSPGGFYDTGGPGIAPGALGAEFGGSFGLSGISGQPGTSAFGAESDPGGGNTSGVGRAIASWAESTAAGPPGAGSLADLSYGGFSGYTGSGSGSNYGGSNYGGGLFSGSGSNYGGSPTGGTSGGRSSSSSSSFGGFGSAGTASGGKSGGPLGASNAPTTYAPTASRGESLADTVGGGTLAGQASKTSSDAPTRGEAEVQSAGPDVGSGRADADPDAAPAPAAAPVSDFGKPAETSAAPEAQTSPSLSDAAPAGNIGGSRDAAPASQGQAPLTQSSQQQSNFGPQSLNADYQGSPYSSNYDQGQPQGQPQAQPTSFDSRFGDWGPTQSYQEAAQQLSDLTQTALTQSDQPNYEGSPYTSNYDQAAQSRGNWGDLPGIYSTGFANAWSDLQSSKAAQVAQDFITSHPLSAISTWLSPTNQQTFNQIANLPNTLNPSNWVNVQSPMGILGQQTALDLQALGEQGKAGQDVPWGSVFVGAAPESGIDPGAEQYGVETGINPGAEQYGTEAYAPGGINPGAEQTGVQTGINPGAEQTGVEATAPAIEAFIQGGRETDFEGERGSIEAFIPGGRETDFDYATQPATQPAPEGQPSYDTTMESGQPGQPTTTDNAATRGSDPALSGYPADPGAAQPGQPAEGQPGQPGAAPSGAAPAAGGQTFVSESAVSAVANAASNAALNVNAPLAAVDAAGTAAYNAALNLASPADQANAASAAALEAGATPAQAQAIAEATYTAAISQPAFTPGQPGQQQQAPPGPEQSGAPVGTQAPPQTQAPPPSLVEQSQQQPGTPMPTARPAEAPSLVDMAQPSVPMPQARPADAPQPGPVGEPDHDEEGEPSVPAQAGGRLGAPTTSTQNTPVATARVRQEQQGATRNRPVSEALHGILTEAAGRADVIVRVGSGGQIATRARADHKQPGGWRGSIRHNHGNAADVRLEQNGRILSFNNPNDLPVMEAFVREGARLGATGMGAGMRYMGENTIHVGFGNPNFWKADNPGSRALQRSYYEGRQGPTNRPPADIPARQARPAAPPGGWRGIGGDIGREARLPQPEVVQPQPPADVPPTPPTEVPVALPPQAPAPLPPADRPPVDVPAPTPPAAAPPTPAQTRAGHVNAAKGIIAEYSKGLENPSGDREARATAAYSKAGAAMAKAGVPANIARAELLKASEEGAARAGYSRTQMWPIGGRVGEAIDRMVDTAMRSYNAAAPGKRSEAPFEQQYAGLSQSLGPAPPTGWSTIPGLERLSPLIAPPAEPPSWGRPPAPPPPPQYRPGGPGMFNPFRGNEANVGGLLHLAAGGRDTGQPPAIGPDLGRGRSEWEAPLPGGMGVNPNSYLMPTDPRSDELSGKVFNPDKNLPNQDINPDAWQAEQEQQQEYQQNLDPRGWQQATLDFLSNFNPISTAEARGRGQSYPVPPGSTRSNPHFTFYGPGAAGKMEGGFETSRPNQAGTNVPITLDMVRSAREQGRDLLVTLASDPSRYGETLPVGTVTYVSPIDGKQYTLDNVRGFVHDTGSAFKGRPEKVDIAVSDYSGWSSRAAGDQTALAHVGRSPNAIAVVGPGEIEAPDTAVGFMPPMPPPAPAALRGLAKGGKVDKDEPVIVGEEGPEYFVPDRPGTVVPHMPQARRPHGDIDRWPKLPAPDYPGRYGGVEREILRQMRAAQNPIPSLMDMVDSGQLRLTPNWQRMLNDPSLIALGRSRIEDRRFEQDPGY